MADEPECDEIMEAALCDMVPDEAERAVHRYAQAHGVSLDEARPVVACSSGSDETREPSDEERAEAAVKWRSQPEILKALDSLDEMLSMLGMEYAITRAPKPADLTELSKRAATVSLRVRSHFRVEHPAVVLPADEPEREA